MPVPYNLCFREAIKVQQVFVMVVAAADIPSVRGFGDYIGGGENVGGRKGFIRVVGCFILP